MKSFLQGLLLLLCSSAYALAQTAPPAPAPVSVYVASVPLTVTTSSARVALPSTVSSAYALTLSNDGTSDLCVALGSTSVVATNGCLTGASSSTSLLVKAGRSLTIFKRLTDVDIAAIGGGATTLTVYQANGPVALQNAGGGSVSGTVAATIADGANVAQGAKADAAATDSTSPWSVISILKGIWSELSAPTLFDVHGTQLDFTLPSLASQSGVWTFVPNAATSGGVGGCGGIVPNNTTGVLCSAGAHQVYHFSGFNNSATIAYLKLYDKATAPTSGTDTPVAGGRKMIPAGGGFEFEASVGFGPFSAGLGYCVTAGIADNDTTSPAANTYIVSIYYK